MFTTLRHPEERIASAYSTMIKRLHGKGWAHRNKVPFNIILWPASKTDISSWNKHFRCMVHKWMETIDKFGWDHGDFWWDQHLIPQYEYLKGYNISQICCTDSLERCFLEIGIRQPSIIRNLYEKANFMPEKKIQSFGLLRDDTKSLVRKLYKDDYRVYDTFCGAGRNDLNFATTQQLQESCRYLFLLHQGWRNFHNSYS